jgi:uncharacterized protein
MRCEIDIAEAREMAVVAAGLSGGWPGGIEGSLAVLRRLGSVQIDTISVVERAHDHVIWSRNAEYEGGHISSLEAAPRRAIEYWSHAAAYLPFEDYRYCVPRMERIKAEGHEWYKTDRAMARRILARVRAEGPLRAQDLEGPKRGAAGWWDWKPEKRALEYLFHAGELVSIGRRSFQKVYDLPERALGPAAAPGRPSPREHAAYYVDLAAASLGVFALEDIAYMRRDGVEEIGGEIDARVEEGRLVEVNIAGLERARAAAIPHFAAPESLVRGGMRAGHGESFGILSPFDPLVIDRKRTARLFGRSFQLECYLPSAKRSFGYFALPILARGGLGGPRLAGRLDAKAVRPDRLLIARRLELDEAPPINGGKPAGPAAVAAALVSALVGFAAFNGADRLSLERFEAYDGRIERSVRAALSRFAR